MQAVYAGLVWELRPGMHIRPQAFKIERLGVMPGPGSFPTLQSKQAMSPNPIPFAWFAPTLCLSASFSFASSAALSMM